MQTPAVSEDTQCAEPRLPVAPGRILCDRYVLTRIIGTGSLYTVFCARDLEAAPASGKSAFVALKTPRPDQLQRDGAVERLKREFAQAQRLAHAGIAQVFELANEGDVWFMTMELVEGESLASILRGQGSALAPYLARRVLRGIGEALAYAHALGIAHGDLDPTNVLVLGGDRTKLIGFAAAPRDGQQPISTAKMAYASPQVLDGDAPQPRDDVFSFACIAYEIATGRHPFQQRPANAARAEGMRPEPMSAFTSEQSRALLAALSFERDDRPQDIRALARTLAPDPQRVRKVALNPEIEVSVQETDEERRWWWVAGACLVAMVASVVLTRMIN